MRFSASVVCVCFLCGVRMVCVSFLCNFNYPFNELVVWCFMFVLCVFVYDLGMICVSFFVYRSRIFLLTWWVRVCFLGVLSLRFCEPAVRFFCSACVCFVDG